ncbi:MAG: hypothetical protein GXP44_02735, partial [bacterium]|nr:hypothetical protein [bacterium]
MAKLFLHIGTHKTGSTAIQRALDKADKSLKTEKIINISSVFTAEYRKLANGNAVDFSGARSKLRKLKDGYSPSHKFVVSQEQFSGDLSKSYRDSPLIAEKLCELAKDFDVHLVVYLRRQDAFLESSYAQFIHQGETWSFEEFLEKVGAFSFDWHSFLGNYAKFFTKDKMIVRSYEDARTKGGLIKDF